MLYNAVIYILGNTFGEHKGGIDENYILGFSGFEQPYRARDRQTDRQTDRTRTRERENSNERETETERERQTDRQTENSNERQTDRQTETETKEKDVCLVSLSFFMHKQISIFIATC